MTNSSNSPATSRKLAVQLIEWLNFEREEGKVSK